VKISYNWNSLNIIPYQTQEGNCDALVKGKTSFLLGKFNLFNEKKEIKHFIISHPFLFAA